MRVLPFVSLASAIGLAAAAPAAAQSDAQGVTAAVAGDQAFDRFIPRPSDEPVAVDYSFFDDALKYMVIGMGQSSREGLGKPAPGMGSRITYGHVSRYRLEGNRIVFSYLDEEAVAPLTEYRADLERIGSELDIASLPRDEQLAYWINLHNVAVIEQIAVNYPVRSPSRMKLGSEGTPLDTTRFLNVGGVALSPNDIRTKIVFPNWDNPNVVYGFFRGEIGSPSIQRRAFTGQNVTDQLASSAREFVNSLRGVEAYGDNLLVSEIYEEAAPFFYPQMGEDFRAHIVEYAYDEVKDLVARKSGVKFNQYDETVADLAAGKREPSYSYIESDRGGTPAAQRTRVTASVARLLGERAQKLEKLRREGLLRGRVIVLPPGTSGESAPATSDDPQAK